MRRACLSRIDEQLEAEPEAAEAGARTGALLDARSRLAAKIAAAAAHENDLG